MPVVEAPSLMEDDAAEVAGREALPSEAGELLVILERASMVLPVFRRAFSGFPQVHARLSKLVLKLEETIATPDLGPDELPTQLRTSQCLQALLDIFENCLIDTIEAELQRFRDEAFNRKSTEHEMHLPDRDAPRQKKPAHQSVPRTRYDRVRALQMLIGYRHLSASPKRLIPPSAISTRLSDETLASFVDIAQAPEDYERGIHMNVDLLVWNLDKIRACEPAPQKPRAQKSRAWQPSQADDVVEAPVSVPPTAALAASDVVDKNLPEIERAEELCCRLTKLHYLLSDNMNCSLSVQHLAGVHLSGFGTDEMDMLLRTCNNMEVWHRTLCRMESSDRRDNCPSICKHVKRSSEFQRLAVLRCHQLRIHAETVRRPPELEEEDKNLKLEPLDQQFPDAPRTQQAFPLSTRLISIFSRGAKKALPDDEAGLQMENARRLQYLLCQSLFYLYKSPWLRDMWDLDNIKIARGNRGYNFNKAYYPYPLGRNPPATLPPNSVEDLQDDTEIETITSKLGLLLLQIEFQRKFPLDAANPDPALTLDQQFKRYQKNLDDSLKGVIEACLNFRCRVDDMCHPKLLSKDLKFRMIVYTDILEPLWLFLTGHWSSVAAGINNCAVRGNLSRQSAMETATPVPESAPEQSKSWGEIRDPATEPGSTGSTGAIGGTMLKRSQPKVLGWFTALDNFNSFLTADPDDTDLDYEQHRVKIVVIDSGLEENRRNEVHIAAYRNFITDPYPPSEDRPSHGTASADLILKAYGRAQLYIAKVFRGDEADDNTPRYMAEAIKWAIEISADIINISAGFWSPCPTELTKAVADAASGGSRHEILIIAAAGNKTTNQPVCAPANVIKHVICMFSCSEGFVQSKKFNPKWRQNADNFTMLGEDVSLGYGPPLEGTSVSTALATGVVGKLLDFARQKSIKSIMGAEIAAKLRTNAGMSAVLKEMAKENLDGKYECIAPWDILPFEPRNSPSTPSAMDKTGVRGRISSRIAEILRPLPCVSYDPEIVEESIQADGG